MFTLLSVYIYQKYKVATKPESGRLASEAARPEFRKSTVFPSQRLYKLWIYKPEFQKTEYHHCKYNYLTVCC